MDAKVVFFDIDGTLKPYQRPVPEPTREALRLLRERGHIPVVCTGRTRAAAEANSWLRELEFSGIICAAGGQVVYQGESVFLRTLPEIQAGRLREILLDGGCIFVLEGPDGLFYDPAQEDEVRRRWVEVFGTEVPLRPIDLGRWPVQKSVAICAEGLRRKGYLPELGARYQLLWYDAGEHLVEIVPRGITKATGIQALLGHLGCPAEDAFAFGDGPNDVEMLTLCGVGIAMGDGQDCAKAAADYITGPCDGTGIYDACRRFGLI